MCQPLNNLHAHCTFQVFLVTGGVTIYKGNGGIRISSSEVYSDNVWRFVGKLKETMYGMSATTLNNKVLLFGKP